MQMRYEKGRFHNPILKVHLVKDFHANSSISAVGYSMEACFRTYVDTSNTYYDKWLQSIGVDWRFAVTIFSFLRFYLQKF